MIHHFADTMAIKMGSKILTQSTLLRKYDTWAVEITGLSAESKNLLQNIILKGQFTWNSRHPVL
jgi:hypothetical protein